MDKEKAKDWQHSGRKIDPILRTVASLVHVQWSFLQPTCTWITFTEWTKGKRYGVKIHTRPCVRVGVRVCVRARVGVCVCVCVWVRGLLFAFLFAWVRACGCVRVCVCACGWGGVQGRRYFWARAHRLVSAYTPGTQRDKLFTFTTTPRLFTTPLYHESKG
jgi:hypothetical protein